MAQCELTGGDWCGYIAVLAVVVVVVVGKTLSGWRLLVECEEEKLERGRRRLDSCAAKGTGKGSRQISRQGGREIARRGLASRAADVAGGAASSAVPTPASGARSGLWSIPPGSGDGRPGREPVRPAPAAAPRARTSSPCDRRQGSSAGKIINATPVRRSSSPLHSARTICVA